MARIATGTSEMDSKKKILWVLLAAAAALYFVRLGASSIWDANEAFYVETPREMLAAHDLINPSFNFLPRFNKPVLSYWMVAGLYKLFGVSVTVERVGIAIGGLVVIACALVLGSLISEGVSPGGRRLSGGLWAAAGLAASPRVVMFARRIFIDVWITAFLSLALTWFALSEHDPAHRRRYLVLMYISIGLATLTKGPVAIVVPALAAALYLTVTREWRRIRELMIPLGILIVAAIVVPWYGALYQAHGWTYIKSFLISENVQRYTSGYGVIQKRGVLFYLPVVLTDSFPISVFLFAAIAAAWSRRRRLRREGAASPPAFRLETLLWCWIGVIVGFFSFSAGKQDLYILPIACAVAALGGATLDRCVTDGRGRGWIEGTLIAAGLLVVIAGTAVLRLFGGAGRVYALNGAIAVGVCGVAGGLLVLAFALRRRPIVAAITLITAMVAIDWIFVVQVLPAFERYKPVVQFSREIEGHLQPDTAVVTYQVALPSLVYYVQRHVDAYFDQNAFVRAVTSVHPVYAILSDENYAALTGSLGGRTCVIGRGPTFDARLNHMLAREPEPQLLLISNVCR